jgi:hypothetical protein
VAHYREYGGVELKQLVSPALTRRLLEALQEWMGLPYVAFPTDPAEVGVFRERLDAFSERFSGTSPRPRADVPFVFDYCTCRELGAAAAALTGITPLRVLSDSVICKLPVDTGRNQETPYHQDLCPMAIDRAGGIQFWLALVEITPEMGAMQHLSGSHREPPLGKCPYTADQKLLELYPRLSQYPLSPAHHFQPGDVLAHDCLTVHYAQPNQTHRLRWAYTSYRIPAHALYTGAPNPWTDGLGLAVDKPLDHPLFPVVT